MSLIKILFASSAAVCVTVLPPKNEHVSGKLEQNFEMLVLKKRKSINGDMFKIDTSYLNPFFLRLIFKILIGGGEYVFSRHIEL